LNYWYLLVVFVALRRKESMGKIRVRTLGDENQEQEQKNEIKKKHEAKKTAKAPGMHGGERVVSVGPTEEELEALEKQEKKTEEAPKQEKKPTKKYKKKKAFHSQKYLTLLAEVDRTKTYGLKEALELLEKLQRKSFDETVELHVNTLTPGVSGQITLPHGTGKKTRVAIASDALIAEVEKGIINFDVLVAEPAMMPKLARVAKILGPRGLMPNPKNGTISPKPEEVAKKYEGGQITFRTEAKAPIIHLTVGKMSFGPEKLSQNIEALIAAIKKSNIVNLTLKSTMSPGLKISV
jgi:large subunit ribosomal protein L1